MSIKDEIGRHTRTGRLQVLEPRYGFLRCERVIFVNDVVRQLLTGDWLDRSKAQASRATLDRFTEGARIDATLSEDPNDSALFKRLQGAEVWEIRLRDPAPSLRVFGAFACQDTFVALRYAYRAVLGRRTSRKWKQEIVRTRQAWQTLFPTYPTLRGDCINDYISNANDTALL